MRAAVQCRIRTEVTIPLHLPDGTTPEATVVTFEGLPDGQEHLALRLGEPADGSPPLVRLHSECMTGDVFGSARCDCGPQLRESLRQISRTGGCLLYLRQEGRGIGLYNKLDAYRLQDVGMDTYEANRALGLDEDARDYTSAARMLGALGLDEIDLLTNNPEKSRQLEGQGVRIRRVVPTGVYATPQNLGYLTAKVSRTAHTIELEGTMP